MILPFYHVNVFTAVPFAGNPAGVVCGSGPFEDEEMRLIAREVGLPGNGFVWPVEDGGTDFQVRFFTPLREVTLSGHTALACAHAILSELEARAAVTSAALRTRTARLTVEREGTRLWLTLPLPELRDYAGPREEPAAALGLTPGDLHARLPLQLTPENDLLLPLADRVDVLRIAPNLAAVAELGRRAGVRGFFVFSTRAGEAEVLTRSRFFAPHFGIPEDIATGSVHGPLMIYLWRHGLIRAMEGKAAFIGEQGEALGRGSRLHLDLLLSGDRPQRVRVGGEAVTVLRGTVARPKS